MKFDFVNRIEVIDETGRAYTNYKVEGTTFDLQDDGRTLKIFITSSDKVCYDKDGVRE